MQRNKIIDISHVSVHTPADRLIAIPAPPGIFDVLLPWCCSGYCLPRCLGCCYHLQFVLQL
jgi:hypothetical protein